MSRSSCSSQGTSFYDRLAGFLAATLAKTWKSSFKYKPFRSAGSSLEALSTKMNMSYRKLIFAVILSAYFLWIAATPLNGSFLDLVDLPIHETGHLIFRPFGEFMMIAGGSLFQVIVPAIFVAYFWWYEKPYSAAIVLFWVGQSIINVYIYAADAVFMQLVLTSGLTGSEGSFHDWNYMLTRLGLLESTKIVAGIIRGLGTLTIVGAAVLSVYHACYSPIEEFEEI